MPAVLFSPGGSPARVAAASAVVDAGVAVMGHVGLSPQSISVLGTTAAPLLAHLIFFSCAFICSLWILSSVLDRVASCKAWLRFVFPNVLLKYLINMSAVNGLLPSVMDQQAHLVYVSHCWNVVGAVTS